MDHYELLGIRRNASARDVKKAYDRKVKAFAKLPGPQRAVQERILKDALATLTDGAKRTDYDSRLEAPEVPVIEPAGSGTIVVALIVVALTAAGIGYFLHERSKERAQMRMDQKRAAEIEKERRAAPAPQPPAKR